MTSPLDIRWSDGNRAFSVLDQGHGVVSFEGAGGSITVDGRLVALADAEGAPCVRTESPSGEVAYSVEHAFPGRGFNWRWDVVRGPRALEVRARIRNTGTRELRLETWNVLHLRKSWGSRLGFPGAALGDTRFFGWHPWDMRVELLSSAEGDHSSCNLCHLTEPVSRRTLLCGFQTLDRMLCSHSLRYTEEDGIGEYRATCELGVYPLAPGRELASETLSISLHDDPYEALESWAEAVWETRRASFPPLPPVGWCGGGWIDAFSDRENSWETVALENARAIREKLRGFDVTYLWTSQYNLVKGLPGNWLAAEPRQIPSGLDAFFRAQEALGFVPALWMAPFWFYSEAEGALERNRENLLRDDDGQPITEMESWEFDIDTDPAGTARLHKYYLDGTHPGTAAFVREVFTYYRRIGVRYYMLDFLGVKERSRLHDATRTPLEAARSMLETIREAAGADTHLQTAVSSTPGFLGLIDAARVGRDFGEGRPLFPPYPAWNNATYALHDQHFGSLHHLVQNAAASYFTHRRCYLNDYNLLTVDKPVPMPHAQIAATVFGLGGGSPLMLGDDYRIIDAERLRLVKLCLPRTTDVPTPVDLFDHVSPDDYCRIVKLAVETEWDRYLLVAVFNLDDIPSAVDLDFQRLGLDPARNYQVYEFWTSEYLGIYRGRVHCGVPPGSCRVYRIAEARPWPWLLSTDLHLQQGAVEIRALRWDADRLTLSVTASRPVGEAGSLFFLMPRKFRLVNHEGSCLMKEVRDMNVVIRTPVRFKEDRVECLLQFAPLNTGWVARRGWLPYASEKEWLDYVRSRRTPGDTRIIE